MRKETVKLVIVLGVIFIFLLLLLRIVFPKQEQIKEVKTSELSPLPTPTLIQKQEERSKVWLEEKSPSRFLLVGSSGVAKYDTLQLSFKSKQKAVKDFVPLESSDFILRVKNLKDEKAIFLFSTAGELGVLESNKPLGEVLLFPGTDVSDLIIDRNMTKIIKRGEEFPVDFEGVKK